jgi:hypothetical protein
MPMRKINNMVKAKVHDCVWLSVLLHPVSYC